MCFTYESFFFDNFLREQREMVQKTEDPVEILEQDLKSKTETLHDDKNNR